VAGLLTEAMLGPVVPAGLRERPPDPTRRTEAAFDAATGTGQDAAGFAIAFVGPPAALACVRRWRPPFDPAAVIADAARPCIAYGVQTVRIDRYAPGFVAAFFREHGITATVAERTTSQHFLELLGLITAQRVTLLDVPELLGELRRLERRPGSGGQDAVSHPPGGHDDVVAAAASALVGAQVIAHHHGMPISVGDGGSYWRDSDESPWRGAGAMRGWP
jgi:hypothetical protein